MVKVLSRRRKYLYYRSLTGSSVGSRDLDGRQTDDRIRNWCSNMLSTQARRDGSHVYRNICSYTYDPLQQKNLLIPAYMPAELAQIDFGKKLVKTFKKSQKPFSMCKTKRFLLLDPNFRLKSISSLFENYLYPYEQMMASLGELHKTPVGGLGLQ